MQALPVNGELIACEHDSRPVDLAKKMWQKAGVADKVCMQQCAPIPRVTGARLLNITSAVGSLAVHQAAGLGTACKTVRWLGVVAVCSRASQAAQGASVHCGCAGMHVVWLPRVEACLRVTQVVSYTTADFVHHPSQTWLCSFVSR